MNRGFGNMAWLKLSLHPLMCIQERGVFVSTESSQRLFKAAVFVMAPKSKRPSAVEWIPPKLCCSHMMESRTATGVNQWPPQAKHTSPMDVLLSQRSETQKST